MPGSQLSVQEISYIRRWRYDEGDALAPSIIAKRLGHNKSTITRYLNNKSKGKWKKGVEKGRRGPQRKLTKAKVALLTPKLNELVKKARGRYEVSAERLRKSARVKVCSRVMMKHLYEETGTKWHRMREKPMLTDEDIKARLGKARQGITKRPPGRCQIDTP